jgi:hypothetical protein
MRAIHSMIAAAAFAFVQPAPAQAATSDPEVIIYRFPGVVDTIGTSNLATTFHCTNFSGTIETTRFVARDFDGSLKANIAIPINHLGTATVSTHGTVAYEEQALLFTGPVTQGTTAIAATSINVICTAMTIDAFSPKVIGVALRGIRFSPVPGSQE